MKNDNPLEVMAAIAMAAVGVLGFLGMPVIVGVLTDGYGLTETQAGYHAAAGMSGGILGSALVSILLNRVDRRFLLFLGLTVGAVSYVTTALSSVFSALLVISFISGLGGGTVYALGIALLARTHHTGKNFSLLLFSQGVLGGLELYFLPLISAKMGAPSVFFALAIGLVLALPLVFLVSGRRVIEESNPETLEDTEHKGLAPWICLGSIFFFYLAVGSFWTYIERLGINIGLTIKTVSTSLTLGNMLALTGCGIAFWLSERVGQGRPLLIALGAMCTAFAVLSTDIGVSQYITGVFVFFLLWNFIDIYQLGTLSELGHSGRHVALVPAFQTVGTALGPAISGWLLAQGWTLSNIMAFNSVILIVVLGGYLAVFSVFFRRRDSASIVI